MAEDFYMENIKREDYVVTAGMFNMAEAYPRNQSFLGKLNFAS